LQITCYNAVVTVNPIRSWESRSQHERLLQVVQPALIGLIDGTVSTLAPIFATAFLAGAHAALLVGLAASLGAGISMGLSEALSDDGSISGRGDATARGAITGCATFLGGTFHSLPFIISNLHIALPIAVAVVSVELVVIALLRRRFLDVTLSRSLIQVTFGGAVVVAVGIAVGQA
jgi:erythrin-vacuolar iron transport family protein